MLKLVTGIFRERSHSVSFFCFDSVDFSLIYFARAVSHMNCSSSWFYPAAIVFVFLSWFRLFLKLVLVRDE